MTREEIMQAVDKKLNSGVVVTCVKGTTDPESHTGYSWEYYVDVCDEPILDEDGYEVETKKNIPYASTIAEKAVLVQLIDMTA